MSKSYINEVLEWLEQGYPREVVERIVSGDLPMDAASRAAREKAQGYVPVYRGHHRNTPVTGDQDIWASTDPSVAKTYANNISNDRGMVSELRVSAPNLAEVNARGKGWSSVETNSNKLKGLQGNPETKGVHKGTDQIAEAVRDSGAYDGTVFRNISDEAVRQRGGQVGDTYNVLGSSPNTRIRSPNAAFDPMYKGSNMMGNADPRLLGGMAVGLSAAGLAAPEVLQRFPMPEAGNRAGWLESVTNFADETQNSLRHATGGVSDYFFPESAVDYLKTVNKEDEEPTWSDRLWAGLDLFKVPGK